MFPSELKVQILYIPPIISNSYLVGQKIMDLIKSKLEEHFPNSDIIFYDFFGDYPEPKWGLTSLLEEIVPNISLKDYLKLMTLFTQKQTSVQGTGCFFQNNEITVISNRVSLTKEKFLNFVEGLNK